MYPLHPERHLTCNPGICFVRPRPCLFHTRISLTCSSTSCNVVSPGWCPGCLQCRILLISSLVTPHPMYCSFLKPIFTFRAMQSFHLWDYFLLSTVLLSWLSYDGVTQSLLSCATGMPLDAQGDASHKSRLISQIPRGRRQRHASRHKSEVFS